MMVFQGNPQRFGYRVQRMLCLMGQQHPGNSHGIHISEIKGKLLPLGIFPDKADIKAGIVRHQHGPLAEA